MLMIQCPTKLDTINKVELPLTNTPMQHASQWSDS